MRIIAGKEVGVGLEKDHLQRIIIEGMADSQAVVDPGQDQE